MTTSAPKHPSDLADLLAGYAPPTGVPDELLDDMGAVRPVWRRLTEILSRLGEADIAREFGRGDQYLRDAGVYYRKYGTESESFRDWPLSHIPVMIHAKEWERITEGLIQRADLLERVCADLYGPNQLIANGDLPAHLIAGNPEWLHPLVGVAPSSGYFLHFLAFDIGRGPTGNWWVLSDRTQAPSGAGFALENRVATRLVFPHLFATSNVERLSGFFRAFRDTMTHHWSGVENQVGILSPGPLNDTYYEHAYIARYLGFMLLEGEDLRVDKGRLMVRTIDGPKPIEVLWRRLDSSWADPLELDETSQLGTPGLVDAVRRQQVTMVNALGAGILETNALRAFLPRLSEVLTGAPLTIPNIATWWCGQETERQYVLDHLDEMVIGPAHSTRPPFEGSGTVPRVDGSMSERRDEYAALFARAGADYVGQEMASLSTTPAFVDGRLQPRPLSLRVFVARTAEGWQVMPGGFARIGHDNDPSAVSLQSGGTTADVWIVGDAPVVAHPLHITTPDPQARRDLGTLPSRAADNLFWLGRYIERAEDIIRQLRAYHARLAEIGAPDGELTEKLAEHLDRRGVDVADCVPEGLLDTLEAGASCGGHVRDRFSVDGWMALLDLFKSTRQLAPRLRPGDPTAQAMGELLRKLNGISGMVHDNMYRFSGWLFLNIGRSVERALNTSHLLAEFLDDDAPEGSLDLILEIGDSAMSHRRLYPFEATVPSVVDLLALDPKNPRAILYQLTELKENAQELPLGKFDGQMSPLSRAILTTHTNLAVCTADQMGARSFLTLADQISGLTGDLTRAYL